MWLAGIWLKAEVLCLLPPSSLEEQLSSALQWEDNFIRITIQRQKNNAVVRVLMKALSG